MNPYLFALFTAASSLSDPTRAVDLDGDGTVTRCERLSVAAFDAYQAAVEQGMTEEQEGADAWAERALDECQADLDANGYVTRCEALVASQFHPNSDAGDIEDYVDRCYQPYRGLDARLAALGYFGVTTFDRALEVSHGCGTPTAWVEAAGKGFVAVCGDDEGRPLSFRGAL